MDQAGKKGSASGFSDDENPVRCWIGDNVGIVRELLGPREETSLEFSPEVGLVISGIKIGASGLRGNGSLLA